MATLANWDNCADPWNSIVETPNSENLEDRFWAAFNLPFDDIAPSGGQRELSYNAAETLSPVVSVKTTLPPFAGQNDLTPANSTNPPRRDIKSTLTEPYCQEHDRDRLHSRSLRLQVPSTTSFASATLSPATAIPRSPFSPSANQSQWHLPTPGGFKPSTPTLQLVSNFLDSIVRLSDSRSSTPAATVSISDDGDTLIVESEVLIQVVEDINRTAFNSPIEQRRDDCFAKLRIPSPLLAISGGCGYDMSSGIVANGPASCAQELDALSWMNWDRQLSNMQHLLWH